MLTFVHISDLHIGQDRSSVELDRDENPRQEVLRDCARIKSDLRGEVSGVLVSGDVAFSGKAEQYERAAAWLKELCSVLDTPEENVWVVPGNHDFDQDARTALWRAACHELRGISTVEIDPRLAGHLDTVDREVLLGPLRAYHDFSSLYGCAPSGPVQVWDARFELTAGLGLRLWGLNTAILADGDETKAGDGLVLGERAVQLPREDDTFIVALWHHPLSWLRDGEMAGRYLNSRAVIHVFGHDHDQQVSADSSTLTLSAGALHPRRGSKKWDPRYNVIEIEPGGTEMRDGLRVSVIPRQWDGASTQFAAEGGGGLVRKDYVVGAGERPAVTGVPDCADEPVDSKQAEAPVNADEDSYESDAGRNQRGLVANRQRRLVLRFATLPFVKRLLVAGELELLGEVDRDAPSYEQTRAVMVRATEMGLLFELWEAVAREAELDDMDPNPYVRSES